MAKQVAPRHPTLTFSRLAEAGTRRRPLFRHSSKMSAIALDRLFSAAALSPSLAVRAGNLRTVRDLPASRALDNSGELVSHVPFWALSYSLPREPALLCRTLAVGGGGERIRASRPLKCHVWRHTSSRESPREPTTVTTWARLAEAPDPHRRTVGDTRPLSAHDPRCQCQHLKIDEVHIGVDAEPRKRRQKPLYDNHGPIPGGGAPARRKDGARTGIVSVVENVLQDIRISTGWL
jgi:hypothetical protein